MSFRTEAENWRQPLECGDSSPLSPRLVQQRPPATAGCLNSGDKSPHSKRSARPLPEGLFAGLRRAFTRLELLASLAALALLVGASWSALGNASRGSETAVCLNNLRQIGRGILIWSDAHGAGLLPWRDGAGAGTQFHPLKQNVWIHFAGISNELGSAKILACPADPLRRPARDFSATPGGLLHPSGRNNAVSYLIGLDANWPPRPYFMVAADRDISVEGAPGNCSSGMIAAALVVRPEPYARWTNELHRAEGNALQLDGHVETYSNLGLRRYLPSADDAGTAHVLVP